MLEIHSIALDQRMAGIDWLMAELETPSIGCLIRHFEVPSPVNHRGAN